MVYIFTEFRFGVADVLGVKEPHASHPSLMRFNYRKLHKSLKVLSAHTHTHTTARVLVVGKVYLISALSSWPDINPRPTLLSPRLCAALVLQLGCT